MSLIQKDTEFDVNWANNKINRLKNIENIEDNKWKKWVSSWEWPRKNNFKLKSFSVRSLRFKEDKIRSTFKSSGFSIF